MSPEVGAPIDWSAVTCSGLMYAAVPRISPTCVITGDVIVSD